MEMAGEHGMEKFHGEFEKLFYTLQRVHENERRLTQKCRQLNDEIEINVARVSTVLQMTQDEQLLTTDIRQVLTTDSHYTTS